MEMSTKNRFRNKTLVWAIAKLILIQFEWTMNLNSVTTQGLRRRTTSNTMEYKIVCFYVLKFWALIT